MTTHAHTAQAAYWDGVAEQIADSDAPDAHMVGYHSPYDAYVRKVAVTLLEDALLHIPAPHIVAELGSGAGLNMRYFAEKRIRTLLAFDCSSKLLALAQKNLSDLTNVTYIQTDAHNIPLPGQTSIDLFFTMTVLQHIVEEPMFQSIASGLKAARPRTILVLEDTNAKRKQPGSDYVLRTPEDYIRAFAGSEYQMVHTRFSSLFWASRGFGLLNHLFGLYRKQEGARLPRAVFALSRMFYPLVAWMDKYAPAGFGMTAIVFCRKDGA